MHHSICGNFQKRKIFKNKGKTNKQTRVILIDDDDGFCAKQQQRVVDDDDDDDFAVAERIVKSFGR